MGLLESFRRPSGSSSSSVARGLTISYIMHALNNKKDDAVSSSIPCNLRRPQFRSVGVAAWEERGGCFLCIFG